MTLVIVVTVTLWAVVEVRSRWSRHTRMQQQFRSIARVVERARCDSNKTADRYGARSDEASIQARAR